MIRTEVVLKDYVLDLLDVNYDASDTYEFLDDQYPELADDEELNEHLRDRRAEVFQQLREWVKENL